MRDGAHGGGRDGGGRVGEFTTYLHSRMLSELVFQQKLTMHATCMWDLPSLQQLLHTSYSAGVGGGDCGGSVTGPGDDGALLLQHGHR